MKKDIKALTCIVEYDNVATFMEDYKSIYKHGKLLLDEETFGSLSLKDGATPWCKVKFVFSSLPDIISVRGRVAGFEKRGDGSSSLAIRFGRFDKENNNVIHRLQNFLSQSNREAFKAPAFLL